MAAPVQHHDPVAMGPYVAQPLGYQQLTTTQLASAIGLTRPGDNAVFAVITVEGAASTDGVRWRDDATPPTGTVGMPIAAGATLTSAPFVYSGDLTAIQFITSGGSPKVNISYYR
jgi:hypothetical protein